MNTTITILALVIILAIPNHKQTTPSKLIIIGSWKYVKFEFDQKLCTSDKKFWIKIDKANQGKCITFSSDDRFFTSNSRNLKNKAIDSGYYKISKTDDFLLIDKDKSKLVFSSLDTVRFYSINKPTMVMVRISN